MVRKPCSAQAGLKKGTWTPEEDRKLFAYVTTYGHWNWRQLPKYAGLARCGKSCRLRWMNYLRPNIKRGNYTKEEEDRIIRLHESLGNKWSAIAAQLPGRTDNEVKNHWHTSLKKRLKQNSSTKSEAAIDIQTPKDHLTFYNNPEINQEGESKIKFVDSQDNQESNLPESSSSPASGQMSSMFTTTDVTSSAGGISSSNHEFEYCLELPYAEPSESFWSEPFLADDKFFDFSVNSPFLESDIILWP